VPNLRSIVLTATALLALALAPTLAFADDSAKLPQASLPEMSMGDPKAPVTIIEYSSLSCPHCAEFHNAVLPKLKSDYIDKGKVLYIMREFPLNDAALAGAVVARCVDPAAFFAFVKVLFAKQEDWAYKDDAFTPLKEFAKQAGLPEDKFNKCLDDKELQKQILAVREEGAKKGVNATPSLFVNGTLLSGGATLENIEAAMKPYLAAGKAS
jgi:protein-disulfide isomerase